MPGALVANIAEAGRAKPLVWLDHFAYTSRLLGGERTWLEPAAFVAYFRKAQALLGSDVAMLPVDRLLAAWLGAHPELAAAMGATGERRRAGFPLRTLLSAEEPRALLVEIAAAVREGFAALPLVLAIPSPARWLVWASARAPGVPALGGAAQGAAASGGGTRGGTETRVGAPSDDDVETAATRVADFLRVFGGLGVDGLLLHEAPGHGPGSLQEVCRYQSVINLADHYRWDVGVEVSGATYVPGPAEGIGFCITDAGSSGGGVCGLVLDDEFWSGAGAPLPPRDGFYFARIPEDASPERVLERLRTLR